MHFFNPPPLMELLEVIRADQTGDRALELARAAGEAMGKRVIVAADGPGFLVNRCGRPFGGGGAAAAPGAGGHARADRPHLPARRRLPDGPVRADGPGRASTWASRWPSRSRSCPSASRAGGPSPIQARMVAAGRLGRKTRPRLLRLRRGRRLPAGRSRAARARAAATARSCRSSGDGPLADGLRERARAAGFELREGGPTELVVDAGRARAERRAGRRAAARAVRRRAASPPAASTGRSASTCCRRSTTRASSS